MNKLVKILLIVVMLVSFTACSNSNDNTDAVKLSFKQANSYQSLKELDGKKVTISGYMATSSPVDGSFIFLMNLPYQSCPFCVPNTSMLSNTMEVMPKDGKSFSYTNQAIKVVGTLVVAENEDQPFEDSYGYQFSFKIVDGEYTILKDSDLTSDMKLWQQIAATDVVNEIYNMYDYVYFTCAWPTYYVNSYTDESGNVQPGYYLWPADAQYFIFEDGAQWNYGYQTDYFENIISKIQSVDKNAFKVLTDNIYKAKELSIRAINELNNGNYSKEYKYIEEFDNYDDVYSLNNGEKLTSDFDEVYNEFVDWLANWEM